MNTTAPIDPEAFPILTSAQLDRAARGGRRRTLEAGETLVEVGDQGVPVFIVARGSLEVAWPAGDGRDFVVEWGPGQFTGEVSTLAGRPALVRIQALGPTEVIEVDHDHLLSLVQTDPELSDILMRAFLLRRVRLIEQGRGDAILVGSRFSAATLRIREFLTRNDHPYAEIDLDGDVEVQELMDRFQVSVADIPVLVCRGKTVLSNPSNQAIADCLGFNEAIDEEKARDLLVVGAGPSGLAAAVYGASEGLDVLVVEATAPGGQAGSSSKIENYLGFPTGISGHDLAARAYAQARKFGADLLIARAATRLHCERRPYALEVSGGQHLPARAIIIATGAEYRRLAVKDLARFEGAGVYYSATAMESQLCGSQDVIVVGGGNSAGQAAVFLAQTSRRVHMLVRAGGLKESMSRYLIRRIEQHPSIELHTHTEVVALEGDGHLERVSWRKAPGEIETHPIRHLFTMAGAVPQTSWLQGCIALDAAAFVRTGTDLTQDDLASAGWPLKRMPYLLETSLPGVFAVGDVRSGNMKRVASAVGEGSVAVALVHRTLLE